MKKLFMSVVALVLTFGMYAQDGANGVASFYANKFEGRKTATGEVFDQKKYTAASNTVKLGTYVKVTNLTNGEVVYVKINDRMAASNKRLIDLASIAADDLRFRNAGTARVKVEEVSREEGRKGVLAQAEGRNAPVNRL
jgi:rare lipoprotein A